MRFTLLPFQETTVGELVSEIRYSMDEVERGGRDQAVVLVAPTGAGKTVMAAAALENLLFGDGQSVGEDDELTVVWLSDLPNVNEQTMQKIETVSERFTGRLIRIDNDFRGDELAAGNVYFLNTQKLGANTNLVSPGDDRDGQRRQRQNRIGYGPAQAGNEYRRHPRGDRCDENDQPETQDDRRASDAGGFPETARVVELQGGRRHAEIKKAR